MNPEEIERLLDRMYRKYGYDFRDYSAATIERRLSKALKDFGYENLEQLETEMLADSRIFETLARVFSVNVTEMFRDPSFYRSLTEKVLPHLQTWPFIRVWVAGCATGEEVYSLAILFKELGVYDKCQIYASDFNPDALRIARERVYPSRAVKSFTANYLKAGGQHDFSKYYIAKHGSVLLDSTLAERVSFSQHNLVSDSVFHEVQLVFCRNVMIYFNEKLKNRAVQLFYDSLERGGFLCLGRKESLLFTERAGSFETIDNVERIYRKKNA